MNCADATVADMWRDAADADEGCDNKAESPQPKDNVIDEYELVTDADTNEFICSEELVWEGEDEEVDELVEDAPEYDSNDEQDYPEDESSSFASSCEDVEKRYGF